MKVCHLQHLINSDRTVDFTLPKKFQRHLILHALIDSNRHVIVSVPEICNSIGIYNIVQVKRQTTSIRNWTVMRFVNVG